MSLNSSLAAEPNPRSPPMLKELRPGMGCPPGSPILALALPMPAQSVELVWNFTHVKFQTSSTDWAGIGNANASIGLPGGQPIPGLSSFSIGGDLGFGSAANDEFNDIKSYQLNEKFTLFRGRHSLKFGVRWLYQRQGFAYAGNEGILGHFDYNG